MKPTLIIPAYNESNRLGAVLEVVAARLDRWDVLVVNDGSTDPTSEVAAGFEGVCVIDLPTNQGKGAALWEGVSRCASEVVVFLDADLAGLRPDHVEALLAPVERGQADMTIGLFRGGRGATDFSHVITPWVSGQRALRRSLFLSLPEVAVSRHGVEALLTQAAIVGRWRVVNAAWTGVTHTMKEEKLGTLPGFQARLRMYGEMFRTVMCGLWTLARPVRRTDVRERAWKRGTDPSGD